jgi:hypothetical protein
MIRKMTHGLLNVQAARSYVPYQVLENRQMLFDQKIHQLAYYHHEIWVSLREQTKVCNR